MKPAVFDMPTEEEILTHLGSSPFQKNATNDNSLPTEEEMRAYMRSVREPQSVSTSSRRANDFISQVRDYIKGVHPAVTKIERFGPGSIPNSKHKQGNALDFHVKEAQTGNEIAQTFLSNPQRFGINALIWNGKIWSERTGWKPQPYRGPHAHRDHVHVEWSSAKMPLALEEFGKDKRVNLHRTQENGASTSIIDRVRQSMNVPGESETSPNIFQRVQKALSDTRAAIKLTPEQSETLRTELKGHSTRKKKLRQIIYSENTPESRKERLAEELSRVEKREAEIIERLQRGVPPRGDERARMQLESRRREALRGEGATVDLDTALARLNSYWYAKTKGEKARGVEGKSLKQVLENPPPDFPSKEELETVRAFLRRASRGGAVAESDLLFAFQQLEDLVRQRTVRARGFETQPRPLHGTVARAMDEEERLYESRAMDEEARGRFLTAGSVLSAFAGGYGLGQLLAGRGMETLLFMMFADPAMATGFDIAKTARAPTVEELIKNFTYSESLGTKLIEEGEPFWKGMILDVLVGHAGGSLFTMARSGIKSLAKNHLSHLRAVTGKPDLDLDIVADLVNDVHKYEIPRQQLPDGSVVHRSPSGSVITQFPDGGTAERLPNGTVIKTKADGSIVVEGDAPREVPEYQPPREAEPEGMKMQRFPKEGAYVADVVSDERLPIKDVEGFPKDVAAAEPPNVRADVEQKLREDAAISSKFPETLSKQADETYASDVPDSRDPVNITPSGKSVIESVTELARKLDIPVSWKKIKGRNILGFYKIDAKQIRIKKPWDIPTIAHEIGHHLDFEFNLLGPRGNTTQVFDKELFYLGRATTPKGAGFEVLRREGVANFVDLFIRDPDAAQRVAPQFFAHYIKNTPQEMQSLVEGIANAVKEFRVDPQAIGQTFALPKSESVLEKFSRSYRTFREDVVDRFDPIRRVIREITGGRSLSRSPRLGRDNPEALLQNYQGIAKKIEHYLDVEQFDAKGKSVGRGLNRILDDISVGEYTLFRNYWKAKHVLDLESKGIKTGAGLEIDDPVKVAQRAIEDVQRKELDAKFDKVIDELRNYSYNLLKYAEDKGMLPEGLSDFLRDKYPHYMPMNRLMEAGIDEEIIGMFAQSMSQKGLVGKKVLHEIKGSTRPTLDPLEQLAKNTIRILQSSDSNEILAKLVKAQGKGPGPFRIVSEGGDNTIKVMVAGKALHVEMAPDLYRAIQQMDDDAIHWSIRVLAVPAQTIRVGAILAPEFMARNPIRDLTAGFINAGMRPWKFLQGLVDIVIPQKFGGKQLLNEYYRAGGGYAILTTQNYQEMQKAALKGRLADGSRIITSRSVWNSVKKAIRLPITLLESLSRISEEATRVGFMKQRIQHYTKKGLSYEDALTQSVAEARDLIDYATRGSRMRNINMLYEFLNAQIQGIDKAARSIKDDPFGFAKRVVMATIVPSFIEFLANKDKDEWLNRPGWQRNFFWSFELEDGTWIRIPKPFELGIPSTIFGGFLEYAFMKNPHAFDEVMRESIEQLVPGLEKYFLPAIVRPIVETVANKNFFFGGKIVPDSREKLEPSLQYTKRSSEVAKLVGQMINVSPAKLDHLVQSYFAGLGRLGLNIADMIYTGEPPKNVKDVYDLPVIRGFIVNPQGPRLVEVEKFYETWKELEREEKSIRDIAKETGQSAFELRTKRGFDVHRYDAYKLAYSFMRFLENEFYNAPTRQEQKAIGNMMLKMAQEFNKSERNVMAVAESILPGISRKMEASERKRAIESERISKQMSR